MPFGLDQFPPSGFSPGTAAVHGLPQGTNFIGPLVDPQPNAGESAMGLKTGDNNFYYRTPDGKDGYLQDSFLANERRIDNKNNQDDLKKKNTKKPKEIINTEHDAKHRHVTPNVVKTKGACVPYPSEGYADNSPRKVTTRTYARRRAIHRSCSLVTTTTKDEPGDPNGGVKSGTRSSIITPITHAPAVRAEGAHVNRHQDHFHGNNKNHLMQVNHVHNTNTYSTSDDQMNDAPDRSGAPSSQPSQGSGSDPAGAFGRNFMKESSTIQMAQGAINNAQYFYNNPSQILPSAANTASNIWTGISHGVSGAYNWATNLTPEQIAALPGQAADGVKNVAVGAYNHYSNIYQQDGIAGLGGAVAGDALDVAVQYVLTEGAGKAVGAVVKGAEIAGDAGAAAKKAERLDRVAAEDGNVRASGEKKEPNKRGENCGCP